MARARKAVQRQNESQSQGKGTNGAVSWKILGGIKKPHKKTATKEEKQAFKAFLKRLEGRDIKLQESGEAVNPNEMDDNSIYEAEEILDASNKDGKLHFMVLWRDQRLENSTWEPETNKGTCMDLIDEFYERFLKKLGGPKVHKVRKIDEE